MIAKILVEKDVILKKIKVSAGVRYWNDCQYSEDGGKTWVKAEDDTEEISNEFKAHIPFVYKEDIGYGLGDYWHFTIDIDTGQIKDWPKGYCIQTNFKVCDDGLYQILDQNWEVVWDSIKSGDYYVPGFLDLEDDGYGDYIFIDVDENGYIHNWDLAKDRILNLFTE